MTEITGAELRELPFEVYDLDAEYDAQVAPLVDALLAKCKELGLPVMMAVSTLQRADGTALIAQSGAMGSPGRTPVIMMAAKLRLDGEHRQAEGLEGIGMLREFAAQKRLAKAH